jgi:hypothetical protein
MIMPYMHSDSRRHGCGGYRPGYRFNGVPQRTHGPGSCRPWRGVLGATSPTRRPTKQATVSRRGYRRSQFIETFLRYLPNDPNIRTLKRKFEKK